MTFLEPIRTAYNTVAESYHSMLRDSLDDIPFYRAMIDAFGSVVSGAVADIGCGPGHLTAHLRGRGVDAFGIDLTPGMIDVARREYPGIRFEVGSMLALDLKDESLGGILASYSIIHMPPTEYPAVFGEFHRVLAPGGHVLVAFHVGDRIRHLTQGYGHDIDLDVHWLRPDHIEALLQDAGLKVIARLVQEHELPDKPQQAVLVAQRPPLMVNTDPTT
ncbi:class I SAM-dependent DNA methyltransferase [Actinocrispum wychmicini]|uniref:class I SAM-dependent DNA methyltransferase n=1 Tax=Actinocrispum wychmicini TaxID=1213861 RepID=UPI001FB7BDC8|nr:class I SAM-dependent methyltransferase [Actinocrispum wychmicini]